jgi:branched-chain amino acid transport system permease protein
MDIGLLAQYVFNGLMLGMIYAMVAVGFTLFFGVLDVIKFSHGDVLMVGAFTALTACLGLQGAGLQDGPSLVLLSMLSAVVAMGALGAAIARWLVLPLRTAPPINVLLITLMAGTALREAVRLFYPSGANPKPFPHLLPSGAISLGTLTLRYDNLILLGVGIGSIVAVHVVVMHTKLGLAIRAVAQDTETAQIMGMNFRRVVLVTFALGSCWA